MGIAILRLDNYKHEKFLCLVFGQGLIGSCITQLLSMRSDFATIHKKVDWTNIASFSPVISEIQDCANTDHIEIVWSAGQGGFSATSSEMERELNIFKIIIGKFNRIRKGAFVVNLISSAGGLYEGQRFIDEQSEVKPRRPYGISKLKQEQFLIQESIPHRIYRVASVYGTAKHGSRIGLINALLINSIIGKTTQIFAKADTFRDYILNIDVARLIAQDIVYSGSYETKIICSGRTVNIQTIVNMVSHITRKKLKVTYVPNNENDEDMVFSHSLVPQNLAISSLEEGMRIVHAAQKFIQI